MYILPLIILCIEIFGKYSSSAISPEHIEKPSSFKAKLAKDEFTAAVKQTKTAANIGRLEAKPTSDINLSDYKTEENFADLGLTPPPEYANDTIQLDSHTYYNSTFYTDSNDAKHFWIDIDSFPQEEIITHAMLSDSHRQATTIELPFDFPFYGSKLRNITIATGGFLYMGDYLHNWIAATQYIAPLMANFDTTLSNNSTIRYANNGTVFTVQWDHVHIQERESDGAFTFQANLFKTGDVSFAYKEIPFPVTQISDEKHPVKIGLSDAYILERAMFFVRRKTIYEYHRVDMMKLNIASNTALYFTALTTCLDYTDCNSCMAAHDTLECSWCDSVNRCSDGVDRLRQSWVANGCILKHQNTCPADSSEKPSVITSKSTDKQKVPTKSSKSHAEHESAGETKTAITWESSTSLSKKASSIVSTVTNDIPKDIPVVTSNSREKSDFDINAHPYVQEKIEERVSVSISTGAIITIVVLIAVIIAVGSWVFYAYRFPQSASGQFFIKYRPAQWSFKSEDRDTNSNAFRM